MSSAARNVLEGGTRLRLAGQFLGILFLFGILAVGSGSATADAPEPPSYDGTMMFPAIGGTLDPEEYSWRVTLGEEMELRAIDDQQAGVYFTEGDLLGFTVSAVPAHDADGSSVPTTLAVSDEDVVTLTVHHRAGDPTTGAPFEYPVKGGDRWDGFQPAYGPSAEPLPVAEAVQSQSDPGCVVPRLGGRSLKASRAKLRQVGCALGKIRGGWSRTARIIKQGVAPGTLLPAGARVSVKLGD